jgi:hypothetical protein
MPQVLCTVAILGLVIPAVSLGRSSGQAAFQHIVVGSGGPSLEVIR